jgi:hypothetical protein
MNNRICDGKIFPREHPERRTLTAESSIIRCTNDRPIDIEGREAIRSIPAFFNRKSGASSRARRVPALDLFHIRARADAG